MTNINKMFTLDGIHYTENKTGYCYKTTGKKDKKGNDITIRIPKSVFEDRYNEYLSMEAELQKWEKDADEEIKARKDKQNKSDKAAEDAVNGKKAEPKTDHYTVRTFYDGMTGYVVEKNGVEVYNGFSVDEIIERFGFNPNEVTEIDIPRKKATKKAKKVRKSKDIAFELKENGETVMTLTAKQVDFMKHLPDTCFWENGLESALWCDVLADEIGGQFAGKPMTTGAMISTLREKGIVEVGREESRQGKPKFMVLTDLGKQIATGMGLN